MNCLECEAAAPEELRTRAGEPLCVSCAANYYIDCAQCGGLVARDETVSSDGLAYCLDCYRRLGNPEVALPDEQEVEHLIREYAALKDEEKRLSDRIKQINETLKTVAAARPRIEGAVVLRAGEVGVKCSYRVAENYDVDRIAQLETLLGPERFAGLFERKISYQGHREAIDSFLAGADADSASARELIVAARELKETPILTIQRNEGRKNSRRKR
jgi:hypothetical protein